MDTMVEIGCLSLHGMDGTVSKLTDLACQWADLGAMQVFLRDTGYRLEISGRGILALAGDMAEPVRAVAAAFAAQPFAATPYGEIRFPDKTDDGRTEGLL